MIIIMIMIFNQGKPVSKCCYQGEPWTTKNITKITITVLKKNYNICIGFVPNERGGSCVF